jgi:uncharacterized protein (DUF305 family)
MTVSTESGESAATSSPDPAGEPPARPRYATGWIIGAVVFGVLVGLAAGLLVPRFLRPGDNSAEAGFLRDMSTHHAQAVDMSMIAHGNTDNADIRTLSADIALTQHGQIGYMQAWLRAWDLGPTGSEPVMAWMPDSEGSVVNGLMPGMATPEQMTRLKAATGRDLDIQFLELMRQHHLGGIHMAQEILNLSDNDDVTWLAKTMVTGQQGELNLIQSLLDGLKASP